jgi:hypothetical protein
VPLFCHYARPGNMTGHVKCDRSCHRACAPLFGRTQVIGGSVAGARSGATIDVLDQGVPAPVACPAPKRERIRTHRASARPRPCRPVVHRFLAAKSHLQTYLQEEDEDSRCLGYIEPGSCHSSPIGGGREPAESNIELGAPKAW